MSKVIVPRGVAAVALSRLLEDLENAEAAGLAGHGVGMRRREQVADLRAALDRDPDALIEQVAKAIYEAGTDSWTTGGYRYSHDHPYEALTSTSHEHYERQAQAALAAITGEGKEA